MKDTLNYKLKMTRHLHKAHWHPEPLELAPVGNEGQVIRKSALKWDIVGASLQVQHADPLSPPELCPAPIRVVELVLVFNHPFIDWDNVLAHPAGLPGLNSQY